MNKSYWVSWIQEFSDVRHILSNHDCAYDDTFSEQLTEKVDMYRELYNYYQEIMPYGTQKARDGDDPYLWIEKRLEMLFQC